MTAELSPRPAHEPQRHWAETAKWRHAYVGLAVSPSDVIVPLCDPMTEIAVVVPTPGQPAPECPDCDQAWRLAENIELRTGHVPTNRSTPEPGCVPTVRPGSASRPRRMVRHDR